MSGVPLNIDFQQILLHLFNVVILFFIMYFLLYKPVKSFMDKRRQAYEEMDQKAQDQLKEAQDLKEGYETRLNRAEEEIQEMKEQASKEMAAKASESAQAAREEAAKILEDARVQAEKERDKIIAGAGDQVTELAKEAASRVVFENPSQAYDSFLNAAKEK